MTDPATCEHYSVMVRGEIACKLCGARYVIDWRGPAHWEPRADVEVNEQGTVVFARDIEEGEIIAVPAALIPKIAEQTVANCPKGSCQRHGRCMYLNHPRCPIRKEPDADLSRHAPERL